MLARLTKAQEQVWALKDAYILLNLLGFTIKNIKVEGASMTFDPITRPQTEKLTIISRECEKPGIEDNVEALRQNLSLRYRCIWDKNVKDYWASQKVTGNKRQVKPLAVLVRAVREVLDQ